MREPSPMPSDKNLGIALSRTLIPTLPAGYLSRKRLFPLIDNEPSGTTFVIAPGGYGKSSLVAEWAQYQDDGVIWMTVANGDTINEMSAMLIASTRQVVPDFAPWFEKEQPLRPTEVVRRWGNELLQTGRQFTSSQPRCALLQIEHQPSQSSQSRHHASKFHEWVQRTS